MFSSPHICFYLHPQTVACESIKIYEFARHTMETDSDSISSSDDDDDYEVVMILKSDILITPHAI